MSSQLTYNSDLSATGLNQAINWLGFFMAGYVKVLLKMHKKYTTFHRFLLITLVLIESSQF